MKVKMLYSLACLTVAAVLLQVQGCTVGGYTIGSVIDGPDSTIVPAERAKTIKLGKQVRVVLSDGGQITGEYMGPDRVAEEEYARMYSSFRKQHKDSVFLPALGGKIEIVPTFGKRVHRQLLGFDCEAGSDQFVLVRSEADTTSRMVLLRSIDKIADAEGDVTDGDLLQRLAAEGQVPSMAAIAIQDSTGMTRIPINNIQRVELKKRRIARWIGLGVGIAVDITVISIYIAIRSIRWFG
jgi:hypothetical protein